MSERKDESERVFYAVPETVACGWVCPDCGREHIAVVGDCSCGFLATQYAALAKENDDE